MKYEVIPPEQIEDLSRLSVSLGNVPFFPGQCAISVMKEGNEVLGFAAAQTATHAAGSWIHEDYRRMGHTYELRKLLEIDLWAKGIPVYFAVPQNDFEKQLFAKYGPVTEATVQIRKLGG